MHYFFNASIILYYKHDENYYVLYTYTVIKYLNTLSLCYPFFYKILNKFVKLKLLQDMVPHHSRHAGNFPRVSGDQNRQFRRLVCIECSEIRNLIKHMFYQQIRLVLKIYVEEKFKKVINCRNLSRLYLISRAINFLMFMEIFVKTL